MGLIIVKKKKKARCVFGPSRAKARGSPRHSNRITNTNNKLGDTILIDNYF